MINHKLIEGLSEQFSQLLQTPNLPGQDAMQEQVRHLLQSTFARMDLVTREEFDAQQAVLARTRDRLEQLEQQLALLEKQVNETE